ncbi:hypothetical protein JX265_011456 [Neoarthrinium moseri]|uniref:CCHC-type domain-containing protein n=1 Tax=Neoarthrinium moseri TaxID=1658444 RepID=A0A9Q0AKL9_9PEZI|nr:hypothetical protein JX265_011456 [Neoarthrinium moseri]
MNSMAPGHQSAHGEPPPCYNCGMRGHIFTACPEPTRDVPAGLEASRARQQAGGSRGDDHPNKRHKGPIVTRYTHPSQQGPPMNPYQPSPSAQPYPYSQPPPHWPPAQVPPPFQGHHGASYPSQQGYSDVYGPPPQPFSAPPYAQPFHQQYGPPGGPPGAAGPPMHFASPSHAQQGPPQPYGPPSHYPPQTYYGYPGPPQGYPPGLPHAPPQGYPLPDYRSFPGPPPPSFPVNPPAGVSRSHETHRQELDSSFSDRRNDRWGDERHPRGRRRDHHDDRRPTVGHDHSGYSRGHSNDGSWSKRGRRDDRRRGDRHHARRHGNVDERHRSQSRPRSDSHHLTQSHNTPSQGTPSVTADGESQQPPTLEALQKTDRFVGPPSAVDNLVVKAEDGASNASNSPVHTESGNGGTSQSSSSHLPDEDFQWELEKAFAEAPSDHKADAIAEPLPGDYSEDILLPPAFDAKCVKSKYATSANLDDFALSIRDTNQWSKYRQHPAFLEPSEVSLQSLDAYIKSIKSHGTRNDRRGRNQARQREHRDHIDRDQRSSGNQRKRKWADQQHPINKPDHGLTSHSPFAQVDHYRHPAKETSPEPGEISDSAPQAFEDFPPHITTIPPTDIDFPRWADSRETISHYDLSKPRPPREVRDYHELDRYHRSSDSRMYRNGDAYNSEPSLRFERSRSPGSRDRWARDSSPGYRQDYTRHGSRGATASSGEPARDLIQERVDAMFPVPSSDYIQQKVTEFHGRSRDRSPSPHPRPARRPSSRRHSKASGTGDRPESRHGPSSRRSSIGNNSQIESVGSPLTPLEAELLGLAGASDDESGNKSPKRQEDTHPPKFKRKRAKVDSAYSRRW